MRRLALCIVAALAAVSALVVQAQPAAAHVNLVASEPAGGATLTEAPSQVTLEFSGRIETSFGGAQVFDPNGQRVDAGEAKVTEQRVAVNLQPLQAAGTHTVVFRIISGDGHPVESRFSFVYRPAAPSPEVTEPAATPTPADRGPGGTATSSPGPTTPTPSPTPAPPASSSGSSPSPAPASSGSTPAGIELQDAGPGTTIGLWAARLANYLALTAVVGFLLAAGVLLAPGGPTDRRQQASARTALFSAGAWVLSCVALFAFALSEAAARPLRDVLWSDIPRRFAATRFGAGILAQGAVALIVTAVIQLTRRSRAGVLAALAITGAGAFAPAWWGHAGTNEPAVVALASDWAHVLAATAWVGGLVALAAIGLRPFDGADLATPSRRFSRVAGWALATVLVTGTVNALLNISAVEQLIETNWGRLVLVKLALFAGIAVLGWRNRTRLLPRVATGDRDGRAAFRSLALAEVGLMVLAFGAATALASTIPAEAEAESRVQSIVAAFGEEGQINLTIDPAEAGVNVVHLYFLDANAQAREVDEPRFIFTGDDAPLIAELFRAGPGHFTVLNQQIPRAGTYQLEIAATVDGERMRTTSAVTIR